MTTSWPAFIVGAALVFLAYVDHFYFSIETLSTAATATCSRRPTGHFVAAIELFTVHLLDVIDDRFDLRPLLAASARLLFANNPAISDHEGLPTLMIRIANERHDIIANATARLWMFKTVVIAEGKPLRCLY